MATIPPTTTPIPPETTSPTITTSPTTTPTTTSPTTTTPTTTSPTTTETTTSPTTTTTSETSSTSTSSETTTSETSTSSAESTSTTIPVVTTTSSTQLTTSTSVDNGVTSTLVVTAPDSSATQSAVSGNNSDDGFFNNTGAVAGVFTVVGLIAVVLIVVLATNAIRRRRAKKFDDEVAAAAAEAGASPRYPFDDYDDPAPGGGFGSYSDPESHGTMSQVPLTHHGGEAYNMSEFNGGYGASYGGSSTAVGAGAAGIGAAAGSLARRNTAPHANYADVPNGAGIAGFGASQNGAGAPHGQVQPYNAFAGPFNAIPADPYDPYTAGHLGIKRQSSRGPNDFLDAAAVGAGTGAVVGGALNRGPSQNNSGSSSLDRSRSQTTQRTLSPDNVGGGKTQESYAAHYQPDFRPDAHRYGSGTAVPAALAAGGGGGAAPASDLPNPFARDGSDEDAYGIDSFSPVGGRDSPVNNERMSIRDEEDYGRAGRTLKVANE